MSRPVRLGAVGYLNARPLMAGLDSQPDRFTIRYDVPSTCARLLHDGEIDLGMIPAVELFARGGYRVVPGASIASEGPVESVAMYASRPTRDVRSIALDTSSRTSAALLRILCARRFGIEPRFEPHAPDVDAMLASCDAALIIGDNALFLEHERRGLRKVDLGREWTDMTGLPFVWAFWAGRPGAAPPDVVAALNAARDAGVARSDELARSYVGADAARVTLAVRYLRECIEYELGPRHRQGLQAYLDAAAELGLISAGEPRYFED